MKNLIIPLLILFSLVLLANYNIYSQNVDTNKLDLNVWIDTQFEKGMDSFNIPGATFILMQGDSILHMNGYGIADIETNTPVNSEFSIFGIGSISKTFVATAIMQLFEEGKLQLDQDINKYLKTFQIVYKFGTPITIRHLLTHTAGFDVRNIGKAAKTEENVISLAQYLKKSMPRQIRPAGEAFTYSNHGYALLGLIVEEVSDIPYDEFVRKRILKPLGMNSSGFKRQPERMNNYVTSYFQKDSILIPYEPDFKLNYPAGGLCSTASDMGHFISMYLNNGYFLSTQILDSITVIQMHETAFKQFEEAENGYLGFREYRWNGLKIVRHDGATQGFSSVLILIPEKNIGLFLCVNISDSKRGIFKSSFINTLWLKLMPDILVEKKSKITPEIGSVAEPLVSFSGTYRYTRYAQTTLDKLGVLTGSAQEVEIISKGDTLEILGRNDKLIPISDLTFYSTKYKEYRAFGRNAQGKISYYFSDGINSFHKLKWYEPVKFQIYWVGSIVLILLISIFVGMTRKLFISNKKGHLIKKINFSVALLIILFLLLIAYVLIKTDPQEFLYGMPLLIKITLLLPFIFIPLKLLSVWLLIKIWRAKELSAIDLIYQSVIIVAALAFIPWLMYWNLIGFNY